MHNATKPWYKQWWGILIILCTWPFTLTYLMWTKTKWHIAIKIAITAFLAIMFMNAAIDSSEMEQKALPLVKEAEVLISEHKVAEALEVLKKAEEVYPHSSSNPAFDLNEQIAQLQSDEFLKETITTMTDGDFELSQNGKLTTRFLENAELNKLFLEKLSESGETRTTFIAENEQLEKQKVIETQFSAWDGSHIQLTRLIKKSMNDPNSYEHVSTTYSESRDFLIVLTTFRGNNAFGAMVKQSVKAKVGLDGEVIEVLEE